MERNKIGFTVVRGGADIELPGKGDPQNFRHNHSESADADLQIS